MGFGAYLGSSAQSDESHRRHFTADAVEYADEQKIQSNFNGANTFGTMKTCLLKYTEYFSTKI